VIAKSEEEDFLFELAFDCETFFDYVRRVKEIYPNFPWMDLKEYWKAKLSGP